MNSKPFTDGRSIVGIGLLAFGGLLLLKNLGIFGGLGSLLWGSLLLAGGALFGMVFVNNRQHWWAIIPGGVLATLSAVAFFGWALPWLSTGALFFFGLAATFVLVYLLARQTWALIPATVLTLIGALTLIGSIGKLLFPLLLIGIGVAMFVRNQRD